MDQMISHENIPLHINLDKKLQHSGLKSGKKVQFRFASNAEINVFLEWSCPGAAFGVKKKISKNLKKC